MVALDRAQLAAKLSRSTPGGMPMKRRTAVALWGLAVGIALLFCGCTEEDNIILPGPDALVVEPDTLNLDDDNQPGILYLATYPPGEVTWRLASAPSWVTVDPESGLAGPQIGEIAVTCVEKGLTPGVHRGRSRIGHSGGHLLRPRRERDPRLRQRFPGSQGGPRVALVPGSGRTERRQSV